MSVEIKGIGRLKKKMIKIPDNLKKQLDKFIQDLGLKIEAFAIENVQAGGVPFVPLSPFTLREKAKLGYSLLPLIRTGDMLRGIHSFRVDIMEFNIISKEPYSIIHEEGAPELNVPRRPFMKPAAEKALSEVPSTLKDLVNITLRVS